MMGARARRLALRSVVSPRLGCERGSALVELLIVLVILSIVMAPLASSFTTGLRQEVDQMRREQAHANARLALQRMRADIHCSGGVTSVDQNGLGGFTLTLTENPQGQEGWCAGVIPAGSSATGVQWCTVPDGGSPTRFDLYRFLGVDASACGASSNSTFRAAYIAQPPDGWPTNSKTTTPPTSWVGNLWPDAAACASGSGRLPTVAIDLSVAVDPVQFPKENYELRDEIALRNANRC